MATDSFATRSSDDSSEEEQVRMRQLYYKLDNARRFISHAVNEEESDGRPVTCFVHPKLTPRKLLEHLHSRGASDACILEWTRRLQNIRSEADKKETGKTSTQIGDEEETTSDSYGVTMMGN